MAREVHVFSTSSILPWSTITACYGHLKLTASYSIVFYNVISQFIFYCGPPMATYVILATVANRVQVIVVDIDKEAGRNE